MTVSFILRPGVGLMRRLRFSAKLALLGGVAVLALLAVAGVQGWGPRATWAVCGVAVLATALALSERFPGERIVVLEKEGQVALHQTGRNSGVVHSADLNGLKAFAEDYPEARLVMLYRGRQRLRRGGVDCIPVEDFLRQLRPGQGLLQAPGPPP